MKISVGIPSYNQGSYIEETVDSLLAQKVPPYEIVVSENHSTDDTEKRLEKYGDKIRIVRPEKHLAMMENWNFLTSYLIGDWISLISSDDVAYPNFVYDLQKSIKNNSNAVLIRGGVSVIDSESKVVNQRLIFSVKKKSSFPDNFREQFHGPKGSFAAFAVKKNAFKEVGGFPAELKLYGDWGLWLKLSPLGSFIRCDKIISGYRSESVYREGQEKRRLPLALRDDFLLFNDIIPNIINKYELEGYNEQFRLISKNRLIIDLSRISILFDRKEDRMDLIKSVEEWIKDFPEIKDSVTQAKNGQLTIETQEKPKYRALVEKAIKKVLFHYRTRFS